MYAVAIDGEVVAWNAAAARLLGIPGTRALGLVCWQVLGGKALVAGGPCGPDCPALVAASAGRGLGGLDLVANRRHVRVHHLTLADAEGEPGLVVHILDDVEDRHSTEDLGRRARDLLPVARLEGTAALTRREGEVLRLVCRGLRAREVAAALGISHSTARTHIQRVNAKLGAHNRAEAVAAALTGGL